MTGFQDCAATADRVEAEITILCDAIADGLQAPARGRDPAPIEALIDALAPHREPLRQALKAFNRVARKPRSADDRAQAKIRSRFQAVGFRLKHWDLVTGHLRRALHATAMPLRPAEPELTVAARHQRVMVEQVYNTLHLQTNAQGQDDAAKAFGAFPDIPLRFWRFTELMSAAYRLAMAQRRARPLRFLDVGCGGATKVLIAASYVDQAHGLEYDPGYVRAAARLLELSATPQASVEAGDALLYDDYGAFDMVYFYRPLQDPVKLIEMERRIADQVPKGTILLAPYDGFLERYHDYGHAFLGRWLYLAHTPVAEAEALLAEAELVGPDVRQPGTLLNRRAGFWTPAVEAAYANGYGLIL